MQLWVYIYIYIYIIHIILVDFHICCYCYSQAHDGVERRLPRPLLGPLDEDHLAILLKYYDCYNTIAAVIAMIAIIL